MEKIESKIKSAEEIAKQFFYSHDINVIRCIKAAQAQAKEAIGDVIKQKAYGLHYEDAFDKNPSFVDVCWKCVDDLINSDELKVS